MPSEALDYISIQGFKSIRSIEKLPLTAINVLVGANGSGKSNFIGAFSFLHAIREARLQDYVRRAGGAEQVLHFGSKVSKEIHLHVSFRREVNQYVVHLQPTQDDSLFVTGEAVYFWGNKQLYSNEQPDCTLESRSVPKGIRDWSETRFSGIAA